MRPLRALRSWTERPPRAPRSWPAPTIRLRLTLTYGTVFLFTGVVFLTIGYVLVRHNLLERSDYRTALRKLGLPDDFHNYGGAPRAGSPEASLVALGRAQLRTQTLHRLLLEYGIALVAMTMFAVATGWLLAGRALAPLREITAAARRVSGENLGERIGLSGPADELRRLADTFDGMLGRLDDAFASQRHFVANASHELRTPLAIMRTEVDVALADPDASVAELRAMGEAIRETVDRCERLLESLLMLARSEALSGREEPVDLAALAADCVTDLRRRGEEAQITIEPALTPAWVHGEPRLLERMIANLIDNGIRHNEPGGFLRVATVSRPEQVGIEVTNGGAVIDPAEVSSLLEPFRRKDRQVAGFGLGLSIVHSVADAHGGSAELRAPAEGGLSVTITLPAGPDPREPARSRALTHS